jgi:transcriptional regulator with XRE-family HTH domain
MLPRGCQWQHGSFPLYLAQGMDEMTISQAILEFRQQMKLSQGAFAKTVGIGKRSLCRYEKGQEPGAVALSRLATLAKDKNVDYLQKIFEAMRDGEVASRAKRLSAEGSQRIRVDTKELSRWAKLQDDVYWGLDTILNNDLKPEHARALLQLLAGMVRSVRDGVAPYLAEPEFEQWRLRRRFDASLRQRITKEGTFDLADIVLAPNVEVRVSEEMGIVFRVHSDPDAAAAAASGYESVRRRLNRQPARKPAKTKKK